MHSQEFSDVLHSESLCSAFMWVFIVKNTQSARQTEIKF